MKSKLPASLAVLSGAMAMLCAAWVWCEEAPSHVAKKLNEKQNSETRSIADEHRVSITVARDRAKLMHNIYSATLDVMHQHYFHESKAVLPARAMEDVFSDMAKQSGIKARWIAVNTKAMSIHHEPNNDFEKKAATEIAAGKEEFESVEGGFYQRAGVIPLSSGCISCHMGFFTAPPKTPRYAGLVISVPVNEK